nr:transporter substrate-binding domain-containing protein [Pseudoalteromonas sp. C2R02]
MNFRIIFTFLLFSPILNAVEPIRFVVPNFPPYMYQKNGELTGEGVSRVSKILKKAAIPFSFKLTTDYDRAIYEVKSGYSDGFFLASQNGERDKIAVFTKPVMQNAWCWFLLRTSNLDPDSAKFKLANVGTILNTNTHKWLSKHKFVSVSGVLEPDTLLKMLSKGRLDAIFLSEAVFLEAIDKLGHSRSYYKTVVQKVRPFGMYLSKGYLAQNPEALETINKAIETLYPVKLKTRK